MRKSSILYLFAAMALLAGCVKETPAPDQAGKTLVISIAPDVEAVKTHMGPTDGTSRKLYWSDGDVIAVNGNPSDALAGLGENATSAAFHFSAPLASAPFNLLYPASVYTDATHVTLPASQT